METTRPQDCDGILDVDAGRNAADEDENSDGELQVDDATNHSLHTSDFSGTICDSLGTLKISYVSRYEGG